MSVPVLLNSNNEVATNNIQAVEEQCNTRTSYGDAAAATFASGVIDQQDHVKMLDSLKCGASEKKFTVHINSVLEPNEKVGLTGDTKVLGEWKLERSVELSQQQNPKEWSVNVLMETCKNIAYRYFIYVVNESGHKQIRRWETNFQPRKLNGADSENIDRFGEIIPGSSSQVNRGWLTNDCIVQLKFEREKMFQVHDVDAFDPQNILIKVVPLKNDVQIQGVNIEVAKFSYGQSQLQSQPLYGTAYTKGDVVIFHLTLPNPIAHAFSLLFHTPDEKLIGSTIINPENINGSEGVLELDVFDTKDTDRNKISHLSLPYMVVKPFAEIPLDFKTTYAHYWPKHWLNLDVGHRGNGKSYIAEPPTERENTLASFQRAYECNADMIELDVHLTSDGIPIIYHDFGVRTAPRGKNVTSPDQLEYVLIKDLTYEAVKRLRVFAVINEKAVEFPSYNDELRPEHRIFPRLIDVLQYLPKTLGIDVEIKWPQSKVCGGVEAAQSIDKNFFVDRVLSIIIRHGCGRPMIFSSFDADLCTMLRFKQNLIPVMFLTQGETKKWIAFTDLRTRNFEQAINHAQAFELVGTAPHAEDFLNHARGSELVGKALSLGQIAVVWGDDCNSKERVQYFNEIGFTATCYDRTDLHVAQDKEKSFFNSTKMMTEFEQQCPS